MKLMPGNNIKTTKDKGKEIRKPPSEEERRLFMSASRLFESELREALKENPTSRHHWFFLGLRLCHQERYEEGIEAFEKCIEHSPVGKAEGAWIGIGSALLELGRFNESEYYLTEALNIEPRYAKAWFNLGALYHRMERFEDAEKAFTEAVNLKPEYKEAWLALGRIHYDLGRRDDARKAYENIVSLDPKCKEALMALGELLILSGELDRAEEIFRGILYRDRRNGDAWHNLGTVLECKGENHEAKHARSMAQRYGTSLDE